MNSNIGSWASNAVSGILLSRVEFTLKLYQWLSSVAFAFALSTDVMITTMMIVYFVRSHTGFERLVEYSVLLYSD